MVWAMVWNWVWTMVLRWSDQNFFGLDNLIRDPLSLESPIRFKFGLESMVRGKFGSGSQSGEREEITSKCSKHSFANMFLNFDYRMTILIFRRRRRWRRMIWRRRYLCTWSCNLHQKRCNSFQRDTIILTSADVILSKQLRDKTCSFHYNSLPTLVENKSQSRKILADKKRKTCILFHQEFSGQAVFASFPRKI